VRTNSWEVEGGNSDLAVGTSCEDLPLVTSVRLSDHGAPNPYEGLDLSAYDSGQVREVPDEQFAALLGSAIPQGKVELDRNLCFRDFTHTRSPLLALIGFVVDRVVKGSEAKGMPNLDALFVYNMPLRALAKNAGQFFSMGVVDAFVREAKGWGLGGLVLMVLAIAFGRGIGLAILLCLLWVFGPWLLAAAVNSLENLRSSKALRVADESRRLE
jgi:beta-glucosidase